MVQVKINGVEYTPTRSNVGYPNDWTGSYLERNGLGNIAVAMSQARIVLLDHVEIEPLKFVWREGSLYLLGRCGVEVTETRVSGIRSSRVL